MNEFCLIKQRSEYTFSSFSKETYNLNNMLRRTHVNTHKTRNNIK